MNLSPKKLLFVLPRFHTNIYWATRALVEAGHSVTVIASRTRSHQELHDVIRPIIATEMSCEEVAATIEVLKPDCIIVRGAGRTFDVAALHARKHSIPLVKYDQAPVPESWPPLYRWWRRKQEQTSTKYRISPVPRKRFDTKGNRREFFMPFPVKPANGALHRSRNGSMRILCVGKLLQPRKNHGHVLTALSNRPHLAGRVELTFCGTTNACSGMSWDYYRDLKSKAAELATLVNVSFRENLEFTEMDQLYAEHDLCILPSFNEPLGSAPLEAMSFGAIPFISNQSGTAKYLTDGFNGHVIDPNDPKSTGEKLVKLIENESLKNALSARASRFAQTELSGEAFVKRFEAMLQRVRS